MFLNIYTMYQCHPADSLHPERLETLVPRYVFNWSAMMGQLGFMLQHWTTPMDATVCMLGLRTLGDLEATPWKMNELQWSRRLENSWLAATFTAKSPKYGQTRTSDYCKMMVTCGGREADSGKADSGKGWQSLGVPKQRELEYVAKLGKAQRAAEETLEMSICISLRFCSCKRFNACRRYHRKCAAWASLHRVTSRLRLTLPRNPAMKTNRPRSRQQRRMTTPTTILPQKVACDWWHCQSFCVFKGSWQVPEFLTCSSLTLGENRNFGITATASLSGDVFSGQLEEDLPQYFQNPLTTTELVKAWPPCFLHERR